MRAGFPQFLTDIRLSFYQIGNVVIEREDFFNFEESKISVISSFFTFPENQENIFLHESTPFIQFLKLCFGKMALHLEVPPPSFFTRCFTSKLKIKEIQ